MFKLLPFAVLFILNFSSNDPYLAKINKDDRTIKEKLEKIAVENLRSWEPPFHEEKMLEPFDRSDALSVVIDGFLIKGYKQWKKIVYESMKSDRDSKFKKYRHIIKEMRTSVLSQNSGAVTVIYTWDYITQDNMHYNNNAAVTLVFKLEGNEWKIIQFHVSHGKKELISENTEKPN